MRAIDADALKKTLEDMCSASNNIKQRRVEDIMLHNIFPQIIDDEPTVEDTGLTPEQINAKNKPAHWHINPDGYYPQCSNCGYEPPRELIRHNGDALIFPRYCPECGADSKREVK